MPVEINEIVSPLVFWRKEFRTDSGGDGEFRGGLGQVIELENRQGNDFAISATYERVVHPARGRRGGGNGATGHLRLDDDSEVAAKGNSVIPGDRRLTISFPGGGGLGDAKERDPDAIERDRRLGYTS